MKPLIERLRIKASKGGIIPIGDMTILEAATELESKQNKLSLLREYLQKQFDECEYILASCQSCQVIKTLLDATS